MLRKNLATVFVLGWIACELSPSLTVMTYSVVCLTNEKMNFRTKTLTRASSGGREERWRCDEVHRWASYFLYLQPKWIPNQT